MSTALARAHEHLEKAVAELESAKTELPAFTIDAATFLCVDVRAACRQIGNLMKGIGAKGRPAS